MKKEKKEVYKEARYGRKALMVFSSVLLAISIGIIAFGICLVIEGCKSDVASSIAFNISFGVMLILLSLASGSISLVMLLTSLGMIKNNQGNVKDGNRAIGTINISKCDKCGSQLTENAAFCHKCGCPVDGTVACQCGTINNIESEFCTGCGKAIERDVSKTTEK